MVFDIPFHLVTRRSLVSASSMCALLVASAVSNGSSATLRPYVPTQDELRQSYSSADQIGKEYSSRAFNLKLEVNWLDGGKRFWYRLDSDKSRHSYVIVDSATGAKRPAFDQVRLAKAIADQTHDEVDAQNLQLRSITFGAGEKSMSFVIGSQGWSCDLETYTLTKGASAPRPRAARPEPWVQETWPADTEGKPSSDGQWTAQIRNNNVFLAPKGSPAKQVTQSGSASAYFARLEWTPDSKHVIAFRVTPGDRKQVYLIQSSPFGGGRAKLKPRIYDLPGDKVDTFDLWLVDTDTGSSKPVQADVVDYGDMPYLRWERDKRHFTYEKMDRGYSRWRIIEVDTVTGESKALVDDHPKTFFDSTTKYSYYCEDTDEIVWRSERDGWGHLYITDGKGQIENQITKGQWVVRSVEHVDEKARQITFAASGMNANEDPYFIHYYRINFDGTGLTPLTPAKGNHSVQFSPDRSWLVDTYSTINTPPVHELRKFSDGALIALVETTNVSALLAYGWQAPEPFVAKGRDGKTDIWGVVYRPSKFNPHRSYPIVENIYAGPQDSFVPKSFIAGSGQGMQSLAELGFIVVQIDGMGTRNRSKAFHDVCFKNIADAGFPDRILWMKALAKKYSYIDLSRVGVYGTSAGGQNSAGAVLNHPEFYKVAVSSCGCHDNRMDKLWWNEQWMGYPVGPEYEAQSNITNASKLKGNLLLMVGELDTNVPPESTYRFVDALEKASKEFDFVVISGSDHTAGGPYGEHKRRDFFVQHLLGVTPPGWN